MKTDLELYSQCINIYKSCKTEQRGIETTIEQIAGEIFATNDDATVTTATIRAIADALYRTYEVDIAVGGLL